MFITFVNFLAEQDMCHIVLLDNILDFWKKSAKNVCERN
jgi:hypothetical protein